MKKWIMLLSMMMLLVLSSGCSNTDDSVDVDGVERSYNASVPDSSSYALVIALHGGGDTVNSFEDYSKLTEEQESSNDSFGVVYLEGIDKHWNDGRPESGSTADDVAFISNIIDKYAEQGANHFYVVGMSNGGVMAQRVACELADKIDGITVVAATQSSYLHDHCVDNTSPVKSMFVFGDSDPIFSNTASTTDYKIKPNRGTHVGIVNTLNYWEERNCNGSNLTQSQIIDNTNDGTSVVVYDSGICNADIKYYKVRNGGHRWPDPSGDNNVVITTLAGTASHEFSTAKEIVKFFGL